MSTNVLVFIDDFSGDEQEEVFAVSASTMETVKNMTAEEMCTFLRDVWFDAADNISPSVAFTRPDVEKRKGSKIRKQWYVTMFFCDADGSEEEVGMRVTEFKATQIKK